MSSFLPKAFEELVEELRRLPGIGPKTAQRLAYHLAVSGPKSIDRLVASLNLAKEKIGYCSLCGNLTDSDPCRICKDSRRDPTTICVVAFPKDALALEKSGGFSGLYHVLHGYIEPLKGVGPEELRVKELLERVKNGVRIEEVILATNPDVDGETTALYLAKLLKPLVGKVTRLARGLPFGADLDYADELTLARSLEGRREIT